MTAELCPICGDVMMIASCGDYVKWVCPSKKNHIKMEVEVMTYPGEWPGLEGSNARA